jgi:hypothetical protein
MVVIPLIHKKAYNSGGLRRESSLNGDDVITPLLHSFCLLYHKSADGCNSFFQINRGICRGYHLLIYATARVLKNQFILEIEGTRKV